MNDDSFDSEIFEKATQDIEKPKIAIFGFTGAGKSALVNAIFGANVASVNARAGWTKTPKFVEHRLFHLIDTPGYGGEGWEDEEFRKTIIEPSDLAIQLLNGAVGVTDDDHRLRSELQNHPGLLTVMNKIDVLEPDELEQARDGALEVLRPRLQTSELLLISAKKRQGLNELARRMTELLPKAKKSGFVGSLREEFIAEREAEALSLVHYYAVSAGVIGLIPIPVADILLLAPLQVSMFLHISRVFGHEFTKDQAAAVIASLVASAGARTLGQTLTSLLKFVPGFGMLAGSVAGSAFAAASFEAFGKLVILYFKKNQQISEDEARDYYQSTFEEAKERYKDTDFESAETGYEDDAIFQQIQKERKK